MKKQQQQKQQQQKLFFQLLAISWFRWLLFQIKIEINISGAGCPAWLSTLQASLGKLSWMAVSFSSISGTSYPAWLWAFQAVWESLSCCEISCMAVRFSSISGTGWLWSISGAAYPASFSCISGISYPAWLGDQRIDQNCVYTMKI